MANGETMNARNVLVVEDDVSLREAIVDTLELADCECIEAANGEEALIALKDNKVSLVISDVQMPGVDGLQLLRSMNRQQFDIPVIMMTAFAKVDDAVVAMREGAVDYLTKPFSIEKLQTLVQRYLPDGAIDDVSPVAEERPVTSVCHGKRVADSDASVMITGPVAPVKKCWRAISINNPVEHRRLLLPLTAQQFLKICWSPCCLAMRKVHLPAQHSRSRVSLNWRRAVLFCSMKSRKCRCTYRQSFCA